MENSKLDTTNYNDAKKHKDSANKQMDIMHSIDDHRSPEYLKAKTNYHFHMSNHHNARHETAGISDAMFHKDKYLETRRKFEFETHSQSKMNTEEHIDRRKFASQGLIHPSSFKDYKKDNQDVDFYATKTGDKMSGKVNSITPTRISFKADKIHGGGLHIFNVSNHLKISKVDDMKESRNIYSVKNTKTGQNYHITKYPSSALSTAVKIRSVGGDHKFAKIHINGKPVEDNELNIKEAMITYHDFASKIEAHKKAGSDVTDTSYKPTKAQYTVVDKEGIARKITHSEGGSKVENLGQHKGDVSDKDKSTSTEPAVKKSRGRPAGSKSGANNKVQTKSSDDGGADYIGYKLHLPNQNR